MEKKPMNMFNKAASFIRKTFNVEPKKKKVRDGVGSMAHKKTVGDLLGNTGRMQGGGMGSSNHPERSFGERKQRADGHGSRPAKKTNKLKCKSKAKRKRRNAE